MNRVSVRKMKIGQKGTVVSVNGCGDIKRRIVDMGITPGAFIVFKKVAPLGDPIEINVRGYNVAIRKKEAENIIVEVE